MNDKVKYNDVEKDYALNPTNLAKIGALDDFHDAYAAIKEIYENAIAVCIKEAETHHKNYWLDDVDPYANKAVRKVCDKLLNKHHFIFRTGLSKLYTNAYGFKSFTILEVDCRINHSNRTYEYTYGYIPFEKFLVGFQRAVTRVLFYKIIQTKPKYPLDKFAFEENEYIEKFTEQFKLNQDDGHQDNAALNSLWNEKGAESVKKTQTKNVTLFRIPDLRKEGLCPVCNQAVDFRKDADLVLQSFNGEMLIITEEVCFCKTCHLFLLDRIIRNKIRPYWEYGYRALGLSINAEDDLDMIKDAMLEPIQQGEKINPLKKHQKKWIAYNEEGEIQSVFNYEIQRYNNQNLSNNPEEFLVYPESFDQCVKCHLEYPTQSTLRPWTLSILIDDEHIIKIPGRMCLKCHNFYLSYMDAWKVEAILDFFSINEHSLNYILQIKTEDLISYNEDDLGIFIAVLEEVNSGTYKTIVITKDMKPECNEDNFLYIGHINTRRFLTHVLHDKQTEVLYDGKKYKVLNYEFKWGKENIIPAEIILGDNGGYYPGEDESLEVVDVLLYSEWSHMYELARATYDKEEKIYYMDISAYREFSLKYGKPDVSFDISIISDKEFGAERSLLNKCGYNVNATDNLSAKERQKILADFIDLEIMTPARIISFLKWVEKKHRKHIEACYKWEEDIAFVRDYKVNPQRFIVGELK